MSKSIQDWADWVHEMAPHIGDGQVSTFVVIDTKGHASKYSRNICHKNLEFVRPQSASDIVTYSDCPVFTGGLLKGPFQAYTDHIKMIGEHAVHITSLDKIPSPVVYNLCIAMRSKEHQDIYERFDAWINDGKDPADAVWLASLRTTPANDVLYSPMSGWHYWLDDGFDPRRIRAGDPDVADRDSYFDKPDACRPCNAIWGGNFFRGVKLRETLNVNDLLERVQLGVRYVDVGAKAKVG